jgi:menaquinone-dependent protoporphyrinogen oxidase
MAQRILVAYDTRNGSTAEVAEAIAATLSGHGVLVGVKHAEAVRDLSGFDALVVGAPIYSGRWLPGAHRVLKRAGKIVPERSMPIAIFALGPRVDEGPENWVRPREQFERALAKHASISPASTALFGGADPPKKSPRRDIRDWDAIRTWAVKIAPLLGVHDGP